MSIFKCLSCSKNTSVEQLDHEEQLTAEVRCITPHGSVIVVSTPSVSPRTVVSPLTLPNTPFQYNDPPTYEAVSRIQKLLDPLPEYKETPIYSKGKYLNYQIDG